jgi:hypothetical protein
MAVEGIATEMANCPRVGVAIIELPVQLSEGKIVTVFEASAVRLVRAIVGEIKFPGLGLVKKTLGDSNWYWAEVVEQEESKFRVEASRITCLA